MAVADTKWLKLASEEPMTETRLPQRHYLACFESITLTINVNQIILPIRAESLIIDPVTMMHWGVLWLLYYHSTIYKLPVPLKR